ncbi:MAG: 3-methyl-2-oxobutanoate hydroxymethyltransferase [Chloroflexi bacterium]|nr:3-methyl-2-oxobutanoate hydroxymethyltransferase [Chloroflexota bacterium]
MADRKKVNLPYLYEKYHKGEPITMLTCYDFPTAYLQEQAGIEMILVGDSLAMTMLGYETTLPATMEDMIRHAQAVRRGSAMSWLIGDMPYMTYQPSTESAIRNAGRFMAEAGCDAVKLEGGREMVDRMAGIIAAGIPCMGHLGLTPQSATSIGGYKVQGKDAARAARIVEDAKILEEAGAYSILLEMVPDRVCQLITERAHIPIISLGSGPHASGQLLIYHDMFGLYPRFKPKMAKVYGNAGEVILNGLKQYVQEVQNNAFPQPEHWFTLKDEAYNELLDLLKD